MQIAICTEVNINSDGLTTVTASGRCVLINGGMLVSTQITTAPFDISGSFATIGSNFKTAVTTALVAAFAAEFNGAVLPRTSTGVPVFQQGA